MKKLLPTASLILILLLFIRCSDDNADRNEDTALIEQIQGRWKLTESFQDDQPLNTPIPNGYEIEFKDENTFLSNEENGYTGGSYTVLKRPANNLRLIFEKNWEAKSVYKYITFVDDQHIYLSGPMEEPTTDGQSLLSGFVLTRIP